jgi:hypothetical protein
MPLRVDYDVSLALLALRDLAGREPTTTPATCARNPHDQHRWAFYSYAAFAHLLTRQFEQAAVCAHAATRIPNCHYWAFAHRAAALGHLRRGDALPTAVVELLERKPEFTCGFACRRLFYVKHPRHLEVYVQGLRQASVPE